MVYRPTLLGFFDFKSNKINVKNKFYHGPTPIMTFIIVESIFIIELGNFFTAVKCPSPIRNNLDY